MKSILSAVILLALVTTNAQANDVGRVIISSGQLQAISQNGARDLARNDRIREGETVRTGTKGYAQIRFRDGALMTLRSDSEVRIDEYRYEGKQDGNEKALMSLLKGGFRTITGLIGRTNKRNYSVRTPVATIGIRGTHYGLALCDGGCGNNENGLYGGVVDGAIVVKNDTGEHLFTNDQYFHVAQGGSKIEGLIAPPGMIFDGKEQSDTEKASEENEDSSNEDKLLAGSPDQNELIDDSTQSDLENEPPPVEGDELTTAGLVSTLGDRVPAGTGVSVALTQDDIFGTTSANGAFSLADFGNNDTQIYYNTVSGKPVFVAALDESNGVQRYYIVNNSTLTHVGNATLSVGGGANVYWGRWDGGYIINDGVVEKEVTGTQHYIIADNLTTLEQLGTLTGTTTYSSNGSDSVSTSDGSTVSTLDINMTVDFTNQTIASYTLTANTGSTFYDVEALDVPIEEAYEDSIQLNGTTSCTTCSGNSSVLFVGDDAGAAITSYTVEETTNGTVLSGASLLESAPPP